MRDNYFVKYGLTVMSAGDVNNLLRGQVEVRRICVPDSCLGEHISQMGSKASCFCVLIKVKVKAHYT